MRILSLVIGGVVGAALVLAPLAEAQRGGGGGGGRPSGGPGMKPTMGGGGHGFRGGGGGHGGWSGRHPGGGGARHPGGGGGGGRHAGWSGGHPGHGQGHHGHGRPHHGHGHGHYYPRYGYGGWWPYWSVGWGWPYYGYGYGWGAAAYYGAPYYHWGGAGGVVDTPVYVNPDPMPAYGEPYRWYCPAAQAYYPDVRECTQPWLKVVPGDTSGPPAADPVPRSLDPAQPSLPSLPSDPAAPALPNASGANPIANPDASLASTRIRLAAPRMTPPGQVAARGAPRTMLASRSVAPGGASRVPEAGATGAGESLYEPIPPATTY